MGLTANELTWETGSEGSNPSLSAEPCVGEARSSKSEDPCGDVDLVWDPAPR
jgi:hypothetical protein